MEGDKIMDEIKYEIQSRHEDFIILYDKFEQTFAIHSKDEDNSVAMITGFKFAGDAIEFAYSRVVAISEDSRKLKDDSVQR